MAQLGSLGESLSAAELEVLAAAMTRRRVPAGTTLLGAGQPNDTLFFIESGELLISLPFETGPLFLGTRSAGSWVGEISLLTPGPATATVTASQDSELLGLTAEAMSRLTTSHPALVRQFVRALARDLAYRVRTAAVVLESGPARPAPGFLQGVFGRLFGAHP